MRALAFVYLASGLVFAWAPAGGIGQEVPRPVPPQVDQQLRQMTPDEIRARIRAAGLTEDEVRRRLQEAGYSPTLLDYYLSAERAAGAQPLSEAELSRVLSALKVPQVAPSQEEAVAQAAAEAAQAAAQAAAAAAGLEEPAAGAARIFGMDLFRRGRTEFQPITQGPVPPNYRLGPGDEIVLVLSGDVQEVYNLEVTREGWIFIPNVGRVSVNGLTLDRLRDALYTYLGRVYSGVRRGDRATTRFEVSIGRLRRNQVFVIGEVRQPGAYELTSVSTVLHALYLAGGPNENGSFRNITVRRGHTIASVLDLYDYLTKGSSAGDIPLEQGDVVFVPVRGKRVTLDGNVVRPAIYELKEGEGLRELIALAGGIEPAADLRRVQIDRVLPPEQRKQGVNRVLIDASPEELLHGDTSAIIPLEAGDRVTVFAVPTEQRNRVTIRGNVWKPGDFELGNGMTLWQLIGKAGGLRDETYRGRAHIARLNKLDLTRYIIPVTLATGPDGAPYEDPPLEEYDEVTIYAVSDFVPERFVAIHGAVTKPGVYPYRENMTLRDLVMEAGGFREDAYVYRAEVSRLVEEPGTGKTRTQVLTVPLDSTYVVTRPSVQLLTGRESDGPGPGAAAPDFYLEKYDNVFVRTKPEWELQRNVAVTGQVRFPGVYSLQSRDERLLSVLERAGGLTDLAYPDGVQFYRRQGGAGRVALDLKALLKNPNHPNNLILQDGDSIHIPEYVPTVRVEGAVLSPASVLWDKGAGLDYYIEQAGGYSPFADKGRVHVRYANGDVDKVHRFLWIRSKPVPKPGSVVVVPFTPPDKKGTDWAGVVRDVVSVGLTVTGLIVAVTR